MCDFSIEILTTILSLDLGVSKRQTKGIPLVCLDWRVID